MIQEHFCIFPTHTYILSRSRYIIFLYPFPNTHMYQNKIKSKKTLPSIEKSFYRRSARKRNSSKFLAGIHSFRHSRAVPLNARSSFQSCLSFKNIYRYRHDARSTYKRVCILAVHIYMCHVSLPYTYTRAAGIYPHTNHMRATYTRAYTYVSLSSI